VQLQEHLAEFQAAGLGVVAMTYDAPDVQNRFVRKFLIGYPLLSDVEAKSVRALAILNTEYQPGHDAYGIPHPGVFVVSPEGTIVGKLFIEAYESRVDATSVLGYARAVLQDSAVP
jgi:peroxiredoxin